MYHCLLPQWQVVTGVLEILYKLLRDHEVTEDDFREEVLELPNGSTVAASKKPGFSLLMHMLNDSPLYKMVSVLLLVSTCGLDHIRDSPCPYNSAVLCVLLVMH